MKCHSKLTLAFSIIIIQFVSIEKSFSDTLDIIVKQPLKIAACQSNSFSVSYLPAGSHYISIYAALSAAGNPVNTACDGSPVHANVFIKIDSIKNSTILYTKTDSIGHDYRWKSHLTANGTDSVKIFYRILIDCANLSDSTGTIPNSILHQTFKDSTTTHFYHVVGTTTDSLVSSTIKTPYFQDNSPSAFNVYYLDTLSALFTYTNNGAVDANISFQFFPASVNTCLPGYLTLEYADSIGGTFSILSPGTLTNAIIKSGYSLQIKQKFLIDNCFQNCGTDTATLIWLCNLPEANANFCSTCQNIFKHGYYFQVADNNFVNIDLLNPIFPTSIQWDHTCLNDTSSEQEWIYRITKPNKGALDSLYVLIDHFTNATPWPNELALIRPGTVFIDTTCIDCLVDTQLITTNLSACNGIIGPSIDSIKIFITRFRNQDTLFVHYKLFRCADENNSALMDVPKFFNQWDISAEAETICGDSTHYGTGTDSGPLDLSLFFLPATTDLSVPKDTIFGDSTRFDVNLNGLLAPYTYPISGLLGCIDDTCTWNGYLKVKIHCDFNLRIAHPDSDVYLTLFDTSTFTPLVRYPVYYYDTLDLAQCDPGDYFFYFHLQDSLTHQIVNHGQFSFQLQACCKINTSQSPYKISFYLIANPGDVSCFNIVFADTILHQQPPLCNGDTCPAIPLSIAQDAIQVHCPGCLAPGIIVDSYNMKRESYGLQDSDNDGRADNPIIQITDTSAWYKTYNSFLDINSSTFGDLVTDRLTAHFEPGSPLSGGYSYAQMQPGGGYLNYLQLYRTIPGALDSILLNINDFTFYIDAPDQVNPNCIDCSEFGIDTNLYRTQQVINVTGANLNNFLDTLISSGQYLFTFSSIHNSGPDTGNLHNTSFYNSYFIDTLNPFLTFYEGQRYRLKVNYSQCGIFPYIGTQDYTDFLKKVRIFNQMALCGIQNTITQFTVKDKMLNTDSLIHTYGYTIDPVDTLTGDTLINSYYAGNHLFFCETFSGVHFFFTEYEYAAGGMYFGYNFNKPVPLDTNCSIVMVAYGTDDMANHLFEMNPYEFRPAPLAPVHFKFDIPPGYYVDTVYTRTAFSYNGKLRYSNMLGIAPPAYTGTLLFNNSSLPQLTCLSQQVTFNGNYEIVADTNDFNQYAGDRSTNREIYVLCKTFLCNDTSYRFKDTTILILMDTSSTSCFSLHYCGLNPPFIGYTDLGNTSIIQRGKDIMILPNLQLTDSTGSAYKEEFCTHLTFSNNDSVINGYNSTHAPNIFIIIPDSVQVPYLTGWSFTFNGNIYTSNSNGVIEITSNLNGDESVSGDLCAYFKACHPDDSIKIYFGWNCNGFPEKLSYDSICYLDSIYYPFIKSNAVLISDGKEPYPVYYSLCDTFKIIIPYRSLILGGIRPDSVFLPYIPYYLSVTDVLIANDTSHISLTPSGTQNTWQISGADLFAIGCTDTLLYSPGYTKMYLIIKALAQCGYKDTAIDNITIYAHKYCGDTLILPTKCDPYIWDSTSLCTSCFTVTKTALQDTAITGDSASFAITICGNNAAIQGVVLTEQLPSDFTLSPFDTIPYIVYVPAQGCTTIVVWGYFNTPGPSSDTIHRNTVIITSADSSYIRQDSMDVVEPCYYQANVIIPDSSFYSTGPTITSGDSIFVEGDWFIDIDVTLTNCTIYTSMFAHIFVMPGIFLTLDGTTITGCQTMWRGIRVEHEAGITLENSSKIADANRGIFMAENSSYFIIHNSAIVDCIREIYVEPYSSNGYHATTCEVYGSQFGKRNANFKTDYPGQPKHGTLAITDFELHDMTNVVIGDNNQQPNYFFRANRGITVVGSNVTVTNSEFEGITVDTSYHWGYDGYALVAREDSVYNRNSRLYVFALAIATNPPTIHDGFRGVYSRHSNLEVRGVYMKNLVGGAMSELSNQGNSITIANCKIEASRSGIRWRNNTGAYNMTAQQNEIILSGDTTGTAIALIESSPGISNYRVLENTITINDTRFGIRSNSAQYPIISGNSIKMLRASSPLRKDGISVSGADSAQVTCNIVSGYAFDVADTVIRGFNINQSPYSLIKCNTVDSTGWGIYFGGIAISTDFQGNSMSNHYHALHLNNTAEIDTQSYSGNRWLVTYDTSVYSFGAVNMNAANASTLAKSEFIVDTINPTVLVPNFPTNPATPPFVKNNGWFDPIIGGGAFECTEDNSCLIADGFSAGSLELRQSIARDSTLTSEYIEESKAMAQIDLFAELKADSVTHATDTILQNFKNSKEFTATGYLYRAKQALSGINKWDSTLIASKMQSDSLFQLYSDSLSTLDSLLKFSFDSLLFLTRINLVGQISAINSNFQLLSNQNEINVNSKITDAETNNNLVSANRLPEENEKAINEIEIVRLKYGIEAIISYYEQIISIASQCPFEGGPAVYKAASLAELINDTISFEYDEICSQHGYYRQPNISSINNELAIKIIPNPTTDQIKIIIEGKSKGICSIALNDAIGKKQINLIFNCKEKEQAIDLKKLLPGIYFVKTTIENNKSFVNKITIIR